MMVDSVVFVTVLGTLRGIGRNRDPTISPAISRLHCAIRCSNSYVCGAFFYDVGAANCYLRGMPLVGDGIQNSNQQTPSHAGYMYLDKARTCLQVKDYIYFRSPMLCIKFDPRTTVWTTAKKKCEKEGARLLMLNSREKIDIVNNTCHTLGLEDACWNLGGRKDSSNGQWTWVDGRRFDEADRQLWGPGEPNGLDKYKQCLQTKFDVPFGLYDGRCFEARMVICERLVEEGASHNTK